MQVVSSSETSANVKLKQVRYVHRLDEVNRLSDAASLMQLDKVNRLNTTCWQIGSGQ
jgi:Cdc6-like AAA superfamily ATPase